LHYDQVGSLRAITDSNHNIIKEITYDTFGNILSDSNEAFKIPFGFAGGLQDSDSGLVRFGYRDYDPFTGKWTAKDPIGFDGGDSNLYGYVLGDPVNFVDPEGLILIAAPFIPALIELAGYAGLGAATTYAVSEAYNNSAVNLATGDDFDPTQGNRRKHPKTGEIGWENEDGLWSKDRAGDRGHGGSAWKKWKNKRDWEKGKEREGTYDKDGCRLRD